MSAIAGILCYNEETVSIEDSIKLMHALQIYPADDVQTWQSGPVFLGCHAQWITPESVHERLPYYDGQPAGHNRGRDHRQPGGIV